MISTTEIDINILEQIGAMYSHTVWNFSMDPVTASANKQKKLRRWINSEYKDTIQEFSDQIKNSFLSDFNDAEFFNFLKECSEILEKNEKEKELRFSEDSAKFSDEVKSALSEFLQQEFFPVTLQKGNDSEFVIDDNASFRRILILKNAVGVPCELSIGYVENIEFENKGENQYRIFGKIEDLSGESMRPFNITFTDAEVRVDVYNCVEFEGISDNPWMFLRSVVSDIDMKAWLSEKYCNDKELDLLPLIKEILALGFWIEQEGGSELKFPHLKKLSAQYAFFEITQMLTALENEKCESRKYNSIVKRLITKLCEQKYEPLWRNIFEKVLNSQTEYPNKAEVCCPVDVLSKTREDIQKLMEKHGFCGTYPDFIKIGQIKGLHLEESYNVPYFIGMEKNTVSRIHCFESLAEEGYFEVQFLCGTALLRKGESVEDVYSCLFNAKGRRFFRTVHYYAPVCQEYDDSDDIEQSVNIAVKKAELKKLTKEERKEYYGKSVVNLGLILTVLLVVGGLFGIIMTLGFLIIEVLAVLLSGRIDIIVQLILDTPWWAVFLFTWLAFVLIMGIITLMAKRK